MGREKYGLTAGKLRELLHYEPETGVFTWRQPRPACRFAPKREAGAVAGGVDKTTGYVQLQLLGKRRLCHRLAWLYMTGNEPQNEVDHINGVRADNRWTNLRDVTKSKNMQNQRAARIDSKTGLKGVQFHAGKGRFVARIKVGGKNRCLGYFDDADVAHQAYLEAKRQHHVGCTI